MIYLLFQKSDSFDKKYKELMEGQHLKPIDLQDGVISDQITDVFETTSKKSSNKSITPSGRTSKQKEPINSDVSD